ncbi:MAG: BspA family leucine-rich repeat surface protein [Bacilli bacterium]|nr:BspA family leucine-rich repeat surface protein [Bacilli bacterium]
MSKKKVIFSAIIVFLLGFLMVKASSSVEITSISIKEKSSTITVDDPVLNNNEVTSNITFNQEGDYVNFGVVLKNNTDKEYKINGITDNNTNENINITYDYPKVIDSGESSTIKVKMLYQNKLVNKDLKINNLVITLETEEGKKKDIIINPETNSKTLVNPLTKDGIFKYLWILLISGITLLIIFKGKKLNKALLMVIVTLLIIPILVGAKESITLRFSDIDIKGEFEVYQVSIDPDNGTDPIIREIKYGDKLGQLPSVSKDGYSFDKWADQDGNDVDEDTVITGPITVTAEYAANTYQVIFNSNGGYGQMDPQEMTYDQKANLIANDFDNGSHGFKEWNTEEDGTGTSYADEAEVKNLTTSGEITLYAQWEKIAKLESGSYVNQKMSNMAYDPDGYSPDVPSIYQIKKTTTLPDGFEPMGDNTISDYDSEEPVYIWYDEDYGIMYWYTEADKIILNEYSNNLFGGLEYLYSIDLLDKLDAHNVQDMSDMFKNVSSFSDYSGLANWNVSNVSNMSNMFYNNQGLSNLSVLNNWNPSHLTNMAGMFYNTSITTLDPLEDWNTAYVTDMSHLFEGCWRLTDFSALSSWHTGNVTSLAYTFANTKLSDLTVVGGWDVRKVQDMERTFSSCNQITTLQPLSGWQTNSVTNVFNMFFMCRSVTNLSGLENFNLSSLTSLKAMFNGCTGITNVDALSGWNTSNITNMEGVFSSCQGLENVNGLANWNTSNVTNMASMFYYNSTLTSLEPLKKWNTSNVTNMANTFRGCQKLESVEGIDQWDLRKVASTTSMFQAASKISGTIKLSKRPTSYGDMFRDAATAEGSELIVNYTSDVTNIDNLINTKSSNSHVTKGELVP